VVWLNPLRRWLIRNKCSGLETSVPISYQALLSVGCCRLDFVALLPELGCGQKWREAWHPMVLSYLDRFGQTLQKDSRAVKDWLDTPPNSETLRHCMVSRSLFL
jgi:hypothetical protein